MNVAPSSSTQNSPLWPRVLFVTALCSALFLPGADCIPRECESNANCVRVCECTDTQAGRTFECPVTYLCGEGTCEDLIRESCDEMCGRVAARGLCGSQRCIDERDCDRAVLCSSQDQVTGIITQFDCDRRFSCDVDIGLCELDFSFATDDQLCQQCALGG